MKHTLRLRQFSVMKTLLQWGSEAHKADSWAVNKSGWRLAWKKSEAGTHNDLQAGAASRPREIAFTQAGL